MFIKFYHAGGAFSSMTPFVRYILKIYFTFSPFYSIITTHLYSTQHRILPRSETLRFTKFTEAYKMKGKGRRLGTFRILFQYNPISPYPSNSLPCSTGLEHPPFFSRNAVQQHRRRSFHQKSSTSSIALDERQNNDR